jgi:hypothetical protein
MVGAPGIIALVALAVAAPKVRVDGVGEIDLDAAAKACTTADPSGLPVGSVVPEDTVFATVASDLWGLADQDRRTWFGAARESVGPWPTLRSDVELIGQLPLAPPGVAAACVAVGQDYADRALSLSKACARDEDACRARIPSLSPAQWKRLQATRRRLESSAPFQAHRSDPTLAAITELDLAKVPDPKPFLDQACLWPQTAATRGLFISQTELGAARQACLVEISLLDQLPDRLDLPCKSPFVELDPSERALLKRGHASDAGLGQAMSVERFDKDLQGRPWTPITGYTELREKIARMDPGVTACPDRIQGSIWKDPRWVTLWTEAQVGRACDDPNIPLEVRGRHCPGLPERLDEACRAGKIEDCLRAGEAWRDALGAPRDRRRAAEAFALACERGVSPGCDARKDLAVEMRAAVAKQISKDNLPTAVGLAVDYRDHLGAGWWGQDGRRLFDAVLAIGRVDLAGNLLQAVPADLRVSWTADAARRLTRARPR